MAMSTSQPAPPVRAAFLHSQEMETFSYPRDCPFRTDRAARTRSILASFGLLTGTHRREVAPRPAGREVLETFHIPEYLDALQDAAAGHLTIEALHMGIGTADCPVFRGMYAYADLACGATVQGADLLLAGEVDVAFNPSGGYHHAHAERAAGFCYLNDVVLGCDRLARAGRRVLFLDVDAHHSDGVQEAFYARDDVMVISLHQNGKTLFPGTGFEEDIGTGQGEGYSVNLPLPPGTYDEAYLRVVREVVLPLIGAYKPDVIALEVGMDCLVGDPLVNLSLTNNAYADVVHAVRAFGRPILAVGGGGYHADNTARGWALVWSVLCGDDDTQDLMAGLGGVLLESTDHVAGLRDRAQVVEPGVRKRVDAELDAAVRKVKQCVFKYHGL